MGRRKATKTDRATIIAKLEGDEIEVELALLNPDETNSRVHSEKNILPIMGSLEKFNQVERLIVQRSRSRVLGGNGRLEAMRRLGWTRCQIKLVDLNDMDADALALTLNRTAELAEWDYKGISETMRAGIK